MNTTTWLDDLDARLAERWARPSSPKSLTVLYDPDCALCRRCREWMSRQPAFVELRFAPATGSDARARYGDIPWLGDELVVLGDGGEVWAGPAAFLTCLWALEEWREWSYRLAGSAFAPMAERFFAAISNRRRALSVWFGHECEDGSCRA